jgi:hypothetical protein
MQVDRHIDLARERPITIDDVGLGANPQVESVRAFCDAFAQRLVDRYVAGDLSWPDADAVANHYYGLMIQHCGRQMPNYAWDVYLAFDEAEIDDRGDAFTRPRLAEIQRKYGRP